MSLIDNLKKKTVLELKSYAKKNNIDLFGVSTKNEILEVIFSFIPREKDKEDKQELVVVQAPKEQVALFSVRNLSWTGVGTLSTGYNIVTKEESEKWLTHTAVRIASPHEVKRAYVK